jgi:hypothetical protein
VLYGTALKGLIDQGVLKAGHGVYTGSAELKDGPLRIWPIMRFLRELTAGNILHRANAHASGHFRKAFDLSPVQMGYIFSAVALPSMLLLVGDIHRLGLTKSLLPGALA